MKIPSLLRNNQLPSPSKQSLVYLSFLMDRSVMKNLSISYLLYWKQKKGILFVHPLWNPFNSYSLIIAIFAPKLGIIKVKMAHKIRICQYHWKSKCREIDSDECDGWRKTFNHYLENANHENIGLKELSTEKIFNRLFPILREYLNRFTNYRSQCSKFVRYSLNDAIYYFT